MAAGSNGREPSQPTPEEIVAEGVYIAAAATQLSLKNRILVETLSDDGTGFAADHYIDVARDSLLQLVSEAESECERLERIIQRAGKRRARPMDMHDYRKNDVDNLKKRKAQSELVARELRKRAEDEDALRELVSAAHEAAWTEIARNIQYNLDSEFAPVPTDVEDPEERSGRIHDVIAVDLPKLERERKRAARLAAEQKPKDEEPQPDSARKKPRTGFFTWLRKQIKLDH
ncbi:hypothetical protein FM112_06430 [Gulosibacter sp. 10]|nr:hypothetical protein FM112_06430 [Gulosibacter sp. 10]